jgi:hypothetical protein
VSSRVEKQQFKGLEIDRKSSAIEDDMYRGEEGKNE